MATKKRINVRLLRKIQKHILEEPRRYDQNLWRIEVDPATNPERPPCGTMACIGGWATALSGKERDSYLGWDVAMRLLGLTREQADRLFDTVEKGTDLNKWPKKFVTAYLKAKTPRDRARVAVRRIDHFIKTKGAE